MHLQTSTSKLVPFYSVSLQLQKEIQKIQMKLKLKIFKILISDTHTIPQNFRNIVEVHKACSVGFTSML